MRKVTCKNCNKEYNLERMGIPLDGYEPCPYCGVEFSENDDVKNESNTSHYNKGNGRQDFDDAFEMIFGL